MAEALKYLEKQQEDGEKLIKALKSWQQASSGKPAEGGSDYNDEPIQSGTLNNADLMEKFSKFKPTRTKDGGRKLHSLFRQQ